MDEAIPQAETRLNGTEVFAARKDKGKGKEREKGTVNGRATEEPLAITYNLNEFGPPPVRIAIPSPPSLLLRLCITRRTKTTARPASLSVL